MNLQQERIRKLLQLKALKDDPLEFLFGTDPFTDRKYVFTVDPHDRDRPVKPLPSLAHARVIAAMWWKNRELVFSIPKSRQVLVTWIAVSLHLWLAMFHEEQKIFVISKNKASAEELINRMKGIYRRLPDWLRDALPTAKSPSELPRSRIDFRHGSSIVALPRGAEQIREHTASAIFVDEAAFVPDLDEVIAAAIPAVAGGGRVLAVSTVYKGTEFDRLARRPPSAQALDQHTVDLCRDVAHMAGLKARKIRDGSEMSMCDGVIVYKTPRSLVMQVHHSAWEDAKRRAQQAKGSLTEAQYLREYELEWDVSGEESVFRDQLENRKNTIIFSAREMTHPPEESIIVYGFDWGFVSPSSILEIVYDPIRDKAFVAWEFYEDGKLISEIAEAILRRPLYYHKNSVGVYADPTIFQRRMPRYSWSPGGIGQALIEAGVRIQKATVGPQARVHDILDRIAREGEPGLVISPTCENLITEMMMLRWDRKKKEKPDESLPSHAIDALGYGLYGIKWRRMALWGFDQEVPIPEPIGIDSEPPSEYDIVYRIIEMKVNMEKERQKRPLGPMGLRRFLIQR